MEVPPALAAAHSRYEGAAGRAWTAVLPGPATAFMDRWELRLDGPPAHGVMALVLPVLRADGSRAVLKLQPVTAESEGEPDDITATGDVPRAVRRRFDLMTEVLGLDRERARGWTLARVPQNTLWEVREGETAVQPAQTAIARALLTR
ncbi:hypothetical protein ABZS71_03340 [Streptomyces sp. NPDC005393]|uniref:hypothetical protein n=1 Tax=Streptomyces sp. NPDC005393 TaxID=3157041 RepID=UPI0033BC8615